MHGTLTSVDSPPTDDDDLLWSIEYWPGVDMDHVGEEARAPIGAYVHPRTGTAARIFHTPAAGGGTYSVQPTMGDFADFDCVIQPDDPGELVSGGMTVLATSIADKSHAQTLAYAWLHGWVQRNTSIGDTAGSIVDEG